MREVFHKLRRGFEQLSLTARPRRAIVSNRRDPGGPRYFGGWPRLRRRQAAARLRDDAAERVRERVRERRDLTDRYAETGDPEVLQELIEYATGSSVESISVRRHGISHETIVSLRRLEDDWNGYGEKSITEEALSMLEALHVSPCHDGGVQIEINAHGWETEVRFGPDGRPVSMAVDRADS